MSSETGKTKALQGQRPAGEPNWLCPAAKHSENGPKSYDLAVYGMWAGVSWILGSQRAGAAEPDPGQTISIPLAKGIRPPPDTLYRDTEPRAPKTGQPGADDNLKQQTGESGPPLANTDYEPAFAAAAPAMALEGEADRIGSTHSYDTTDRIAEGRQSPSLSRPEISVPGALPSPLPMQDAQSEGEQHPAGGPPFMEAHALQHSLASWSEPIALALAAFAEGKVTVIDGDYYDIQISFDSGLFNFQANRADGAEIAFGSVLESPASEYDLIVIDQDLVEINVILQLNIGAIGASASGLDMQTNQAVIVDYSNCGEFQLTRGAIVDVASVKQINYLANVSFAAQFNDAAILNGACEYAPSDGHEALTTGFPADHDDLMPALSTDLYSSVLHVTGTYYEINLIVQISALAAQDGGNAQLNSAVIHDFDGVGLHQFVGGDEYDLNAISQANYLSQIGQLSLFALSDFFANEGAIGGPVRSAGANANNSAADSLAGPDVAGPPTALPLGIGGLSGEMTSDLITS